MNSRERIGNRRKGVEGGQRRWVKRGDGARMETAETKGGERAREEVGRERRTGRRTRCPRGRMKGRLPATTY